DGPKAETCRAGRDQRQFADRCGVGEQSYDVIIIRVVIDPRKPRRIWGAGVSEEGECATAGKQGKHEKTPPAEVSSSTIVPLGTAREILPSYPFTHAASRRAAQAERRECSPHTRPCQARASARTSAPCVRLRALYPSRLSLSSGVLPYIPPGDLGSICFRKVALWHLECFMCAP